MGWPSCPVNNSDTLGTQLYNSLRESMRANWAPASLGKYEGQWKLFTQFCAERTPPLPCLPATEEGVAMFLQHRMNSVGAYSTVKGSSAAIAAAHRMARLPAVTRTPLVRAVKEAAKRKFGVAVKNMKAPFQWQDLVRFVRQSCNRASSPPRWMLGVLALLCFGCMARYDCVHDLRWGQVDTSQDAWVEVEFGKRKSNQYRARGKTRLSKSRDASICPVRLLREWRQMLMGADADPNARVFPMFDGVMVAQGHEWDNAFRHRNRPIPYSQFRTYLSKWFAPLLRMTAQQFLKKFGTKSGRSGGASAASNAGIAVERWGQHGGWKTFESQKHYMQLDDAALLEVSQTIMPTGPAQQAGAAHTSHSDSETESDSDVSLD